MHKRLFIPGPVEVIPEILEHMAEPMIGHRSKEASALQRRIAERLGQLMFTRSTIVLSTSSGSGLMEGAIRSCTSRRAAVFSIGAFGERWHKMAVANGVPADLFASAPGQASDPRQIDQALAGGKYDVLAITHNETATGVANPLEDIAAVMMRYPDVVWLVDAVSSFSGHRIEVDRLGIDVLIASSQKCLGLPPGLAVCSVSDKAYAAAERVPQRGLYFDLVELVRFVRDKDHQYPSTPALSLYYALDRQLDRIIAEGIEARFARHAAMAGQVQAWARDRFALFADPRYLSNTVTCVANTRSVDVAELNGALAQRGMVLSDGYGPLKGKTFRIAHMADTTSADIDRLLEAIDDFLEEPRRMA